MIRWRARSNALRRRCCLAPGDCWMGVLRGLRDLRTYAVLLVAMAVLNGCASLALAPERVTRAAPFEIVGRVLVSYDGKGFTAGVRWAHAADADEVWLMTPTGQALAQIREDAEGATLVGVDQVKYRAGNIEAMTKRALGWELPAKRLQHWVRGTPAPDTPAEITERDESGRIRRLTQDGWRITYEYYAAPENAGLPRRMDVVGATQTLRLVIDNWERAAP